MKIALKIISCLSIALALFLTYTIIDEMLDNLSLSEIDFLSLLIFIIVIANAVLALLILFGKKKLRREYLILQLFVIVPTSLFVYQILFNSTVSCT